MLTIVRRFCTFIPNRCIGVSTLKLGNCIEIVGSRNLCSKQTEDLAASPGTLIPLEEIQRFVIDSMTKVGTPYDHAKSLADVLVVADYRGHFSHGLNRLEMYVNDVQASICNATAKPEIVQDKFATALVNGNNGLGPVVGNFSMQLAIEKAKQFGVGWVAANNSNHYGIAGWYSLQAAEQGLMGLSFTNTSPLVAPTRAKKAALGTNPISLAAPALNGDHFVLDMATSAVAIGKIEVHRRKGQPIPSGWSIDQEGKVTTDADLAFKKGCLMPLGGPEYTSGYKGYGLGVLVEILCGISAGATYGPNVRRWMNTDRKADLGQCFIAVDPESFAPGFQSRLTDLMTYLRNMEAAESEKPVLVAGDPERMHMAKVQLQGGVRYHENQIRACANLAEKLQIKPMKALD